MEIRTEIKDTINEFLIDEFELEEESLVETAQLKDDLDIESLDFVDIAVIVEKEFGFKVVNEEMINIRTLGDLYAYVQTKVDAK
jgi:acyl carrier protein